MITDLDLAFYSLMIMSTVYYVNGYITNYRLSLGLAFLILLIDIVTTLKK